MGIFWESADFYVTAVCLGVTGHLDRGGKL